MAVDLRDLTPAEWAFVAVLVLLAMAGLYYVYTLLCGYRCLPLETTDCPGGKPHHLVYVDDVELGMLADHAEHPGKPCHGIRSFEPGDFDFDDPNARATANQGLKRRAVSFYDANKNDPEYQHPVFGVLDEKRLMTDAIKAANPHAASRKKARLDFGANPLQGAAGGTAFHVEGGAPSMA